MSGPYSDEFERKQRRRLLSLREYVTGEKIAFADDGSSFALKLLSDAISPLDEIDRALDKIGSGRYGVCEASGLVVSKERLEMLPFARYTVEAQERLESGKKRKEDDFNLSNSHDVNISRQRSDLSKEMTEDADELSDFEIGEMYFLSDPPNLTEAVKFFTKAAKQGDANAQDMLGDLYYDGKGVPQSHAKAVKFYKKAADAGHESAQFSLGYMYYHGESVPFDPFEAARWYQKSAHQGCMVAQAALADMYFDGVGFSENKTKAFKWYRRAAKQGDARSQGIIGKAYLEGEVVEIDFKKAHKWLSRAANQDDLTGRLYLGKIYGEALGVEQDLEKAATLWEEVAAELGDSSTYLDLADNFLLGNGVPEDVYKAEEWYFAAAELGDIEAFYRLGVFYDVVFTNHREAAKWFGKAADAGHAKSQFNLGNMYFNGLGVPLDVQKAGQLFIESANQGDQDAQFELGKMCYEGIGFCEDREIAKAWFLRSAEQGNEEAQRALDEYYSQPVPDSSASQIPSDGLKGDDKRFDDDCLVQSDISVDSASNAATDQPVEVDTLLGISSDMGSEEIKAHLNKLFRKYSARASHDDPKISEKARKRLEMIGEARARHIGFK